MSWFKRESPRRTASPPLKTGAMPYHHSYYDGNGRYRTIPVDGVGTDRFALGWKGNHVIFRLDQPPPGAMHELMEVLKPYRRSEATGPDEHGGDDDCPIRFVDTVPGREEEAIGELLSTAVRLGLLDEAGRTTAQEELLRKEQRIVTLDGTVLQTLASQRYFSDRIIRVEARNPLTEEQVDKLKAISAPAFVYRRADAQGASYEVCSGFLRAQAAAAVAEALKGKNLLSTQDAEKIKTEFAVPASSPVRYT